MDSSDIFRRKNNRSPGCVDNNRHIRTSVISVFLANRESDERLTKDCFSFCFNSSNSIFSFCFFRLPSRAVPIRNARP